MRKKIISTSLLIMASTFFFNTHPAIADYLLDAENAYAQKNYQKAFKLYSKACQKGNTDGCLSLGFMYEEGKGVPKNYQKAIELYSETCKMGDAEGCVNLGNMYAIGKGVPKNYQKVIELYSKACKMGNSKGCFFLGSMYETIYKDSEIKSLQKALKLYLKACSMWNEIGCITLLEHYKHKKFQKEYSKIFKSYLKACKTGNAEDCNILGFIYEIGLGVQKNYQKAFKLYSKACKMGNAEGCVNLAFMYKEGKGIRKNYQKAFEYNSKACKMGDARGCSGLGSLYEQGLGVQKNYQKAFELYSKACQIGDSNGCDSLGDMYKRGEGVLIDYNKALFFYYKACSIGEERACDSATQLKNRISKIPSPFGLKVGLTTEEEFKEIIKRKGWKIEKSGYRIIKDNISNPNITGYVISGIPLKKIESAYFWFFKGKLMQIEYRFYESMDKSTFYIYYDILRSKYGNPDTYVKPSLANGKAIWNINGIEIELYCPWVSKFTFLTYTDPDLYSQAEKSDKEIYQQAIKHKAKSLEGL